MIGRFHKFLNTEPDEHPFTEVLSGIVTSTSNRAFCETKGGFSHAPPAICVGRVCWRGHLVLFHTADRLVSCAHRSGGLGALTAIDPTETVGVFMRVAILCGVILAVPYIAFELWLFAAPGLRPREKIGLFGISLSSLFFIGGIATTYLVLLPTAFPFLFNFLHIKNEWRPQTYFSLITSLMFWLGVTFELPLLIYVLTAIGFVKPRVLVDQWRLAVIIIAILAAVITPTTDFFNMALVMLPVTLLYFISIGFSYVAYAGRMKEKII